MSSDEAFRCMMSVENGLQAQLEIELSRTVISTEESTVLVNGRMTRTGAAIDRNRSRGLLSERIGMYAIVE